MRWVRQYHANRNVFSRRLKAASAKFGLQTRSERLFQVVGAATAKARRPISPHFSRNSEFVGAKMPPSPSKFGSAKTKSNRTDQNG